MSRWLWLSIASTFLAFAVVCYIFLVEPDLLLDRVPVHWNIEFEPDEFVPRDQALGYFLLYPGVMALLVVVTLILPWLSPKNYKIEPFRNVFDYAMMLIVIFFGFLLAVQIGASTRAAVAPGRWFVAGVFVLFVLLGSVMGKVERNFWMGVRTPWTLASEPVWTATHRLAGWLWMAAGVVGVLAVLAGIPFLWCFIGLVAAALFPVLNSLILYKSLERQDKV
jgi:uncharacterized membrane protein